VIHTDAARAAPLNVSYNSLSVQPATGGTSFGQPISVGAMPGGTVTAPAGIDTTSSDGLVLDSTALPLITLGAQGLVMQLETLVVSPDGVSVVLSPARGAGGTLFTPADSSHASLGSASPCAALLQDADGSCTVSPAYAAR